MFTYRSAYYVGAPTKSAEVFASLRKSYPSHIGGVRVTGIRDLGTGVDTSQPGTQGGAATAETAATGQPGLDPEVQTWSRVLACAGGEATLYWQPGDLMITFTLEGPATLTLRASGTEPKLKYYLETRDDVALADRLQAAVERELVQPERHGLRLPAQSV